MTTKSLTAALAALLCGWGPAAGLAYATAEPEWRCARAVSLATQDLLRGQTRHLHRCALALLDTRGAFPAERLCAPLHTPGDALDRRERNALNRIASRCRMGLGTWVPEACSADPATAIDSPEALARCALRTTRCAAVAALGDIHGDLRSLLESQNPENLRFAYAAIDGNTLGACFDDIPTVTTTTLSTGSTTTTTLAGVTTTTMIMTSPPQLVITELMSNPAAQSDSAGEYFEIFNAGTQSIDLQGLVVHDDGSDTFTIDTPLQVAAGAYAVLGKSATAADGAAHFVYGSAMTLANSADAINLVWNGTLLERLAYDGSFPLAAGASTQVDPAAHAAAANDDPAVWCLSDAVMADGDAGTPGATNRACP